MGKMSVGMVRMEPIEDGNVAVDALKNDGRHNGEKGGGDREVMEGD